jgi:GNAT superfamily N-acetyltransferase
LGGREINVVQVTIERLHDLPADGLEALLADSEQAGSRIVRRLVDEWVSGANRFDQSGKGLFAAWTGGRLVGICGLNVDPYAPEERVGRVRHLYVLSAVRRLGVGRALIAEVVDAARGLFDTLHLRTRNPEAARLYEAFGFRRSGGAADYTHLVEIASASPNFPVQRTERSRFSHPGR